MALQLLMSSKGYGRRMFEFADTELGIFR